MKLNEISAESFLVETSNENRPKPTKILRRSCFFWKAFEPSMTTNQNAFTEQVKVAIIIVLNVIFSVGVIFANKHLFQDLKFTHSATLTGLHFVSTTLFSYALHALRIEQVNELDFRTIAVLSVATCVSIWFANFSLLLNTVGFYQVTKLAIIPCTVLLQWILYRTSTTTSVKMALSVLTFGVGIATFTQVDLRVIGFIVSGIAVLSTCFQQIIYSMFMKDKKINGVQLYYNIGPLSATLMLLGGLIVDYNLNNGHTILDIELTPDTLNWIVLSSAFAAPMNFTSAMMLEKTSALTYQVVGHAKTIIIFLFGAWFFAAIITAQNAVGFAIAMTGVIWYSNLQIAEKNKKATLPTTNVGTSSSSIQMDSLKEDEVVFEKASFNSSDQSK